MEQNHTKMFEARTEIAQGGVSTQLAAQIHATLAPSTASAPATGTPMPALWHWMAFPPTAPMSELGSDGHPKLGGFLPDLGRSRRMWAGGALEFKAPLHVDEQLTKSSTIRSITEKDGPTGPMSFVTVDHEISGEAGVAIRERQDIVYLDIPEAYTPPRKTPVPENSTAQRSIPVPPTLLFRYSALTFNAHRIHYDLDYTRDVEHYPGLVVHGPLQATLAMQMAVELGGSTPDRFEYRGIHPLFAGADLQIYGTRQDGGQIDVAIGAAEGHQTLKGTATWEDI
ncbi:MaoC family dehydratase N-terminal domain-containing protein [Cognatishimia sp. MH4019]|uniref:FAS1-like dehydratase domain-containing protein n=1 Tax=Cognatishimia sp. MH4019 TaxID=2854030 RepID=UPI001CD3D6EF|nr:MaoC family dehydratase N-terminal domain-containing protein [Cognatishimia sp. MH4019]